MSRRTKGITRDAGNEDSLTPEWVIALRCARIDDDGLLTAYAGAGIVIDSDPDSELAETRMKFRPIADALR